MDGEEGLHVQTEWLVNDRAYTAKGRPPSPNGGLAQDRRKWGGYGLVGYRTPWFGVMPFVKAEYSPEPQTQSLGISDQLAWVSGGLNVRPEARIVVKAEFVHAWFPHGDPEDFGGSEINGLDLQVAWAF